jgi:hypothetical protein
MRLSSGRYFSRSSLGVVRVECAERLTALTAWPARSSTGTAIELAPFEFLVHDEKSLFPVSANTIEQRPHVDGILGAKRFRCP